MKKILLSFILIVAALYIILCTALYFLQEKIIFYPERVDKNHNYSFSGAFNEQFITAKDGVRLSTVLFKADSTRGAILYLHGNGGSIRTWGDAAETYTNMHYDVLMVDYRGYGKSEGKICGQQQLYNDIQTIYNQLAKTYRQDRIIVLGYSIGTGLAAKVAADNNPGLLILQAPYYSLTDRMQHQYPFLPAFILKYKFRTDEFIQQCKMPVIIFHGTEDEIIYYNSSVKLQQKMKKGDSLITLHGQGHNGITSNPQYLQCMRQILNKF